VQEEKDMSEPQPLEQFVARQLASGRYHSYDELVEDALRLLQEREVEEDRNGEADAGAQAPPAKKPIWEIAEELLAEVPEEAFDRLPVDGAAQHDHYIYGTPKRPA
jgi:putative addiction module CopG family antidote